MSAGNDKEIADWGEGWEVVVVIKTGDGKKDARALLIHHGGEVGMRKA